MTINLNDWGAVARAVFLWLPAVIALAWLAGRLLGIRLSWSRTIISGLIGAAAGGALAQILARQQHGAGFNRNLWLFTLSSRCRPSRGWRCCPGRARSRGRRRGSPGCRAR